MHSGGDEGLFTDQPSLTEAYRQRLTSPLPQTMKSAGLIRDNSGTRLGPGNTSVSVENVRRVDRHHESQGSRFLVILNSDALPVERHQIL